MVYITFLIAGGLISSQFGPAVGIVGALTGLTLAGSESRTSGMSSTFDSGCSS